MGEQTTKPLPDYERPPVIEVVCGIQFEPLPRFQTTAFGLFYQRVRESYAVVEEHAPLDPVVEQPDLLPAQRARVEVHPIPPLPRLFFVHHTPNWLMQVQRDRFLHNWRKLSDEDRYPRYPAVFESFWHAWRQFRDFCQAEDLGPPSVNQLEITYINHIPCGEAWNTLNDLATVFPDVSWRSNRAFLPPPDSAAFRLAFTLPDSLGRLHVSVRHAVRVTSSTPVLLCELTARGMPKNSEDADLQAWFGLGREWIVRGFADLTGDDIQRRLWLRRS